MAYKKIAKIFNELESVAPHSMEYYRLIRVADEELNKINFDKSVKEAILQAKLEYNEKQYTLEI